MTRLSFNQWRNSPDALLQCVFLIHFLFSAWSELGRWSGSALTFQNTFFLLTLLWALHEKRSPTPVIIAMAINLLCIVLDIIVIALFYPKYGNSTSEFSAVMAIFNLILRVVSTIILFKSMDQRDELDGPIPRLPTQTMSTISVSGLPNNQPTNNNEVVPEVVTEAKKAKKSKKRDRSL
ncbi:type-1 angiotensin II receptor-associated protein-like isoform X2 [Tigriopus californicus]|uniref:type-1 angiotensin II receptor-associated protein-like isoform X2 n=1 Tax=Tigriopus californicus TaxID=6832 RepID=UPI0027DAA046|nr:type-1 angiotensin II receptor-associated protein-like isoform X2 [Tigriopus californicus]